MTKRTKFKNQKGLALAELLVALGVLAVLGLAVWNQISRTNAASSETRLLNEIGELRVAANNFRGNRPNYTGLTCEALVSDDYVEFPWANCSGVNPLGGNYTIGPHSSNNSNITATATGLGESLCNRVARSFEPNAMGAACSGGTLTVHFRG
ncbi:prepilin-type N-terminal cleavage/methylation domain-containing protein [Marinimicrobium sp. ABcell2]|uniref:prepilin-type N-terminal cleavage/methylation domain-containing protein n=1 Tax=Marinimicrobium sp. ABcell2 TaxID=3069751 RepID=UPI0027B4BC39|nr:prepilin-type N-terminal cleavage/methylation domain-containing protein [Marinimicrobium sp. ABcell2]MDQ2077384.1 prepilin-type N-terminal cleavage/methylation domain-containing protein [Marinimicrobium sp. ABcell2]